jgi:hypothetical protein
MHAVVEWGVVDRPQRYPEFICGNIFVRPNCLTNVGDRLPGHTHNFDHVMLVLKGSFLITVKYPDGTARGRTFKAPSWALIRAEMEHEVEALEKDSIFWCVYSHRDPQGRVTQEVTGWEEAYS